MAGCLYTCLICSPNISDIIQVTYYVQERSSEHELLIRKQLHGVIGA